MMRPLVVVENGRHKLMIAAQGPWCFQGQGPGEGKQINFVQNIIKIDSILRGGLNETTKIFSNGDSGCSDDLVFWLFDSGGRGIKSQLSMFSGVQQYLEIINGVDFNDGQFFDFHFREIPIMLDTIH